MKEKRKEKRKKENFGKKKTSVVLPVLYCLKCFKFQEGGPRQRLSSLSLKFTVMPLLNRAIIIKNYKQMFEILEERQIF